MLIQALNFRRTSGDLMGHVAKLDRAGLRSRVAALRRDHPKLSKDGLHRKLVHAKCIQAGLIGGVAGMAGLVPVLGRMAQTVLGPIADAALVTTLQAELVAETLALYEVDLPDDAERMAILAVAATNMGAAAVSKQAAKAVAHQAARLVGGTIAKRAMPIAGIVTTAAANIGVTYLIGMRAQALAKMKDAPLEDWPDLIRGVTSLDERKLARWAADAARSAIDEVSDTALGWLSKLNGYVRPMIPGTSRSKRVEPTRAKPRRKRAAKPAAKRATPAKPAAKRSTAPRKATAKRAATPGTRRATRKSTRTKRAPQ
ncbi:MAG TPA: hypothetical protein VFO79_01110 [Xanthomonadales bacterium]|nr:hypothetical protein [Xanthomonadales bacterium]